jgi:UDP-N-acetylglucosamine acyltransferase
VTIHPLAAVSPKAHLGSDIQIGPFCNIECGAVIEDGCQLGSHVVVKQGTTLGAGSRVMDGAILGGLPQHTKIPDQPGRLIIGRRNVIREFCTFHCSLYADKATRIGDDNLFMVGAHVAHDCEVGNNVILTNNVLLAGHVTVQDRVFMGGASAVHQFARIGRLAMIGGHARVTQDVPPFVTVDGGSSMIVGLNRVGLTRAGFDAAQIAQLKEAYKLIYRRGLLWKDVLAALDEEFPTGAAAEFLPFLSGGSRGFLPERRPPRAATIKLHDHRDDEPGYQTKAG